MRKKRLAYNSISALIYQITAILCGFILPRLILKAYNSEVNGLVNSITQFLQIIAILDLGVGTVVKTSLYKPLSDKNDKEISKVLKSAKKFFNNIAKVLVIYMCVLPIIFVFFLNKNFDFLFTASLIIAIGINYFAQYYFGIVNQLLLNADQKGYIQYNLQTITLIINTIVCSLLIVKGSSIQVVKFATSIIFLARPLYLKYYVSKNYKIDYSIQYDNEPIKQKWNGVAQHLTAVVLDSTDTIVLTIFSTLKDVSIYSVYYLVIHGIRQLVQLITNGVQSLFGNLIATKETDKLQKFFDFIEWAIHTIAVFLFGCTSIIIIPFVIVYTRGVTDVNYINHIFGMLITYAHGVFCLRIPYHFLITAAGHYKETQRVHIVSVFLNIVISIALVNFLGLIGVAIGTLISMGYQTIWMALYCSKKLLNRSYKHFIKLMILDFITLLVGSICTCFIPFVSTTYSSLIIYAILIATIWGVIVLVINLIFSQKMFKYIISFVIKRKRK